MCWTILSMDGEGEGWFRSGAAALLVFLARSVGRQCFRVDCVLCHSWRHRDTRSWSTSLEGQVHAAQDGIHHTCVMCLIPHRNGAICGQVIYGLP